MECINTKNWPCDELGSGWSAFIHVIMGEITVFIVRSVVVVLFMSSCIVSPALADERLTSQISCELSRTRIEVVVCTDQLLSKQHKIITEEIDQQLIMNRFVSHDPHYRKTNDLSWLEALKIACQDDFEDVLYEIAVSCIRQEYSVLMGSVGRGDVQRLTGVTVPCYELNEKFEEKNVSRRTVRFCFFVSSMVFEHEYENRIRSGEHDQRVDQISRFKSIYKIDKLYRQNKEDAILIFNSYAPRGGTRWKVADCNVVISIFGGQNESVGGLCVLEREGRLENVAICHDTMVGHFWLVPVEEVGFNIIDLSLFVTSRCVGG